MLCLLTAITVAVANPSPTDCEIAWESNVPSWAPAPSWLVRGQDDSDDSESEDNDLWLYLLGAAAVAAAGTSPFWLPMTWLDNPETFCFPKYPYHRELPGYVLSHRNREPHWDWTLQKSLDAATDGEDLRQVHGHLLWEDVSRIGIDGEFNYLRAPESAGPGTVEAWAGDLNFTWMFAYDTRAVFRSGLGVVALRDSTQTQIGPNFTYSSDVFPARPWVLSLAVDAGLIEGRGVIRGRFTAGLEFHGIETYAGYAYSNYRDIEFSGLICGLRVWL